MYPNLILPGAQKSASSTVATILTSHEDIYGGNRKEPHLFTVEERFADISVPYREFYDDYQDQRYVLDASQSYLPLPHVPERIADKLGTDLKFIIVLRQPVARALSGFVHMRVRFNGEVKRNPEDLIPRDIDSMDMEELIEFERVNTRNVIDSGHINPRNPSWDPYLYPFNYFYLGCYARQIENFFKIFPRENFMFLTFEQATRDQDAVRNKLSEFLDLDPEKFAPLEDVWTYKTLKYKKGAPLLLHLKKPLKMLLPRPIIERLKVFEEKSLMEKPDYRFATDTYNKLLKIFLPEIDRAAEITGLNLDHWKKFKSE